MSRTTTFIALALSVVALGLVACGGSEDDPGIGSGASTDLTPESLMPDGNYVGLSIEEASMLADARQTPWRIGREGDESFALTQDYVVGRVTFEVDEGIVTLALIEGEKASGSGPQESDAGDHDEGAAIPARGGLFAAAIERIVKTDNSFGGGTPFERVEIENVVGGAIASVMTDDEFQTIKVAISDVTMVESIASAAEAIDGYFDSGEPVAVVSIDGVQVDNTNAQVKLSLWCGSLCGIFLTYEAELVEGEWLIVETVGPIAVS
jgi:hypothetical protein